MFPWQPLIEVTWNLHTFWKPLVTVPWWSPIWDSIYIRDSEGTACLKVTGSRVSLSFCPRSNAVLVSVIRGGLWAWSWAGSKNEPVAESPHGWAASVTDKAAKTEAPASPTEGTSAAHGGLPLSMGGRTFWNHQPTSSSSVTVMRMLDGHEPQDSICVSWEWGCMGRSPTP